MVALAGLLIIINDPVLITANNKTIKRDQKRQCPIVIANRGYTIPTMQYRVDTKLTVPLRMTGCDWSLELGTSLSTKAEEIGC